VIDMAHHKRRRSKKQRAGCLCCKPWKDPAVKDTGGARKPAQIRADESAKVSFAETDDRNE
jgi:hypothetical protein